MFNMFLVSSKWCILLLVLEWMKKWVRKKWRGENDVVREAPVGDEADMVGEA